MLSENFKLQSAHNILLIDDEVDFTELTAALLRFYDFTVTTLNDASHVMALLESQPAQLVVTDLMMPRVDGLQLIQQLRERTATATIPILTLTAKVLTDSERKFLLQHQVVVLTKPFEPQRLVDQIRQLLCTG